MNEYMITLTEAEAATAADESRLIEGRAAWRKQVETSGAMLDGGALRPSTEGRRVHVDGDAVQVDKGPFAGALTAYCSVKAQDIDAAVALAKQLPLLPNQTCEVRPIMKGAHDAKKSDKPGKVFAFGVLGNAPNEEAWIRLMDRIDADTSRPSERLPDKFLAGVRLEAPRTGRRLVMKQGKPVVLDGPFLEGKEVIGGLFFMRLPSLEDAVEWVSTTPFVRIGSAEIREVWRS
jgi:hypothetical protein